MGELCSGFVVCDEFLEENFDVIGDDGVEEGRVLASHPLVVLDDSVEVVAANAHS